LAGKKSVYQFVFRIRRTAVQRWRTKAPQKLKLTASLAEEGQRILEEGDAADSSAHTEEKRSNEKSKSKFRANNSHENAPTDHESDAERKSSQDSSIIPMINCPAPLDNHNEHTNATNTTTNTATPTATTAITPPPTTPKVLAPSNYSGATGNSNTNQSAKDKDKTDRKGQRMAASRKGKGKGKNPGGFLTVEDLPDARSDLSGEAEETVDINLINVDEEEQDEVIDFMYTDSTAADAPSDLSLSHVTLYPVTAST